MLSDSSARGPLEARRRYISIQCAVGRYHPATSGSGGVETLPLVSSRSPTAQTKTKPCLKTHCSGEGAKTNPIARASSPRELIPNRNQNQTKNSKKIFLDLITSDLNYWHTHFVRRMRESGRLAHSSLPDERCTAAASRKPRDGVVVGVPERPLGRARSANFFSGF